MGEVGSVDVWRRKWLVILPVVLAGLTAAVLSVNATPQYRAAADVLVRLPPTASSAGSVLSPRMVENELETAQGSELRADVHEGVGSEPVLAVTSSDESDVFRFSAVSSNASNVTLAANTYAQTYIDRQRSELVTEFEARGAVLQDQLDAIDRGEGDPTRATQYREQLEDLRVSAELAETSGARLIDRATTPGMPFEPQPAQTVMLALVVGALLGLGAAFLVDYLDRMIRDEEELQRYSSVPNLVTIQRLPNSKKNAPPLVVSRSEPGSI
jgi:capsular polysaccharide biosynthesis protein